jgi:predicted DNA binding CopG/RHH family protein
LKSDKEAENFLDQDLTDYLEPENFARVSFEFEPKDTSISIRLSSELLQAVKAASAKRGIGYQKFIREALERVVREG